MSDADITNNVVKLMTIKPIGRAPVSVPPSPLARVCPTQADAMASAPQPDAHASEGDLARGFIRKVRTDAA